MTEKQDRLMTRKKFIKISSAGLLGVGLLGKSTAPLGKSLNNQVEKNPEHRMLGRTGIKVTALGYGASHVTEPSLVKRVEPPILRKEREPSFIHRKMVGWLTFR